jgi:endoglycosylceramidase
MAVRLFRLAGIACLLAAALPALAGALPTLSHHGRWLTDPQGRVVILHGVEFDRYKPGTQIEGWIDAAPQAPGFVASQGFNLARVSIELSGIEPQLGQFDASYVAPFVHFDRQLASAGVYDLVTLMQGMYNAQFDGSGFPDWMVQTDGVPNTPGPFPQSYIYDPAEQRAWDHFWANSPASDGVGLQDHFGQGLRYLARDFASQPGFLGFDLLNEPWAGSQYPSCVNPAGCPVFDQSLNAFYRRIVPELRAADPQHLVFYEPHALFDQGAASNVGAIGDPGAVFTFHNYCLGDQPGLPQADPGQNCGTNEQIVLNNAEAQAAHGNDGLLEDEWGNTASVPLLERMAAEADQHMIGWSYWAYEDCCGSPGAIVNDGSKDPNAPGNLNLPVLQGLVRPYPQLISGSPTPWSFDPPSKKFTLQYSIRGVAGRQFPAGSPSEVFIPQLQYPHGYRVSVAGADIASQPTAGRLVLCSQAGANDVTVRVTPDATSTTELPASPGQDVSCPAPSSAATSIAASGGTAGGGAVTVSRGGGSVTAPGTGTVRLPGTARCLAARRIHIRLHLARGARLLSLSARVNGQRRSVHADRAGGITIPIRAGTPRRVNLHLAIRVRTRRGIRTLYLNRRYTAC